MSTVDCNLRMRIMVAASENVCFFSGEIEMSAKATQKQTFSGASTSAVHCCLLLWE